MCLKAIFRTFIISFTWSNADLSCFVKGGLFLLYGEDKTKEKISRIHQLWLFPWYICSWYFEFKLFALQFQFLCLHWPPSISHDISFCEYTVFWSAIWSGRCENLNGVYGISILLLLTSLLRLFRNMCKAIYPPPTQLAYLPPNDILRPPAQPDPLTPLHCSSSSSALVSGQSLYSSQKRRDLTQRNSFFPGHSNSHWNRTHSSLP